jgi:phage baseplate assembly protein W
MADIIGSGLAFPVRVDRRGGVALVSGDEDVNEAIQVIIGTARGERRMRPEFGCGIHDYVFESIDAYTVSCIEREIRLALDRWEPRIDVVEIETDTGDAELGKLQIRIVYALRGTNDVRNLVYPFYVIPAEEIA